MGTNTLLDEIPAYFVVEFCKRKLHLESKEKQVCNASAILDWISGTLPVINKLELVAMIVSSSLKFSFSHKV